MSIYPVIMAGGSGTRFWPLSRKTKPKQFLALTGEQPLLQMSLQRMRDLAPLERTLVVCGKVHASAVQEMLPELPTKNILVEPIARNTAPCVALAAAVVAKQDPQGVLVVLPSDQHVREVGAFVGSLEVAVEAASRGLLVTIGVKPSRPETGYGYVQQGAIIKDGNFQVREVKRFVEKPDVETAKNYLGSGDFLWNAGIFVLRVDRVLEEFNLHLPETKEPLAAVSRAVGTAEFNTVLERHFPQMPSISFDYGIMEKASRIAVVPAEFGWSDVGSFPALPEVRLLDAQNNVAEGETILCEVSNSIILGGKRPLAVIGVKDLVVVDAGDAVLVCPRERAQEVRRVVDELGRRKLEKYL